MPVRSATALAALAALVVIWIPRAAGFPGEQTLTVDNANAYEGSVTSSPAGISCGSRCTATFASGSMVTLIATPREEDAFSGFRGDCSGPALRCTLTMDAAKTVHVNFFGFTFYGVKLRGKAGNRADHLQGGGAGRAGPERRRRQAPDALDSLRGRVLARDRPDRSHFENAEEGGQGSGPVQGRVHPHRRRTGRPADDGADRRSPARRRPVSLSCIRLGAHGNETIWTCGGHL